MIAIRARDENQIELIDLVRIPRPYPLLITSQKDAYYNEKTPSIDDGVFIVAAIGFRTDTVRPQ